MPRIMRAAPDRRSADGDGRPQLLDADRRGLELRLAALASRGLGIAILPESVARVHPELHAIEVTRPAMRGRLALAWRTGGTISPAARALISRARSGVANSAVEGQPAA